MTLNCLAHGWDVERWNYSIWATGVNHRDGLDVQIAKKSFGVDSHSCTHSTHNTTFTICKHVMGMTLNYYHTEC